MVSSKAAAAVKSRAVRLGLQFPSMEPFYRQENQDGRHRPPTSTPSIVAERRSHDEVIVCRCDGQRHWATVDHVSTTHTCLPTRDVWRVVPDPSPTACSVEALEGRIGYFYHCFAKLWSPRLVKLGRRVERGLHRASGGVVLGIVAA